MSGKIDDLYCCTVVDSGWKEMKESTCMIIPTNVGNNSFGPIDLVLVMFRR